METKSKETVADNSLVLGHLLSQEEIVMVTGGLSAAGTSSTTDIWADTNTCTPTRDGVS